MQHDIGENYIFEKAKLGFAYLLSPSRYITFGLKFLTTKTTLLIEIYLLFIEFRATLFRIRDKEEDEDTTTQNNEDTKE